MLQSSGSQRLGHDLAAEQLRREKIQQLSQDQGRDGQPLSRVGTQRGQHGRPWASATGLHLAPVLLPPHHFQAHPAPFPHCLHQV